MIKKTWEKMKKIFLKNISIWKHFKVVFNHSIDKKHKQIL